MRVWERRGCGICGNWGEGKKRAMKKWSCEPAASLQLNQTTQSLQPEPAAEPNSVTATSQPARQPVPRRAQKCRRAPHSQLQPHFNNRHPRPPALLHSHRPVPDRSSVEDPARHELQDHSPVGFPLFCPLVSLQLRSPFYQTHQLTQFSDASTGAPSSSPSTGPSTDTFGEGRRCISGRSLRPTSTSRSRASCVYGPRNPKPPSTAC